MRESANSPVWRVGTSGWSYPPRTGAGTWTGVFYPFKKIDELEFYSRYFRTVEINSTFYRPASSRTAESWVNRTPADFDFAVKVWQQFTHTPAPITAADIGVFKDGIEPIVTASKLAILLFQFPSSFHCDDGTRDRLRQLLDAFSNYPKAVELRHRSWDGHRDVLDDSDSVAVFTDEPKFRDSTREKLGGPTRGIIYMRLHGRNAEKWWHHEHRDERYDYFYSPEEIRSQAGRLKAISDEYPIQKAYIFYNNHPGGKAVANAAMLRSALGIGIPEPLPDSLIRTFPSIEHADLSR